MSGGRAPALYGTPEIAGNPSRKRDRLGACFELNRSRVANYISSRRRALFPNNYGGGDRFEGSFSLFFGVSHSAYLIYAITVHGVKLGSNNSVVSMGIALWRFTWLWLVYPVMILVRNWIIARPVVS